MIEKKGLIGNKILKVLQRYKITDKVKINDIQSYFLLHFIK